MLRFVPKAVIFDEERGKMAVLNSVESTIPETLSGQDIFHICPGQIGLPGLAVVFYTELSLVRFAKIAELGCKPSAFFFGRS